MPKVFISYSRKDLAFVQRLVKDLQAAGVDTWYDTSDLGIGTRWGREIQKAIQHSQYSLIILSPNSIDSEWVEKEYLYASSNQIKIIPILYEACKLPVWFINLQFIDLQKENYPLHLGDLLKTLGVSQGGMDRQPESTQAPGLEPAGLEPHRKKSRHNLPAQLTSFIGREKEITEGKRLLEGRRLVTLIGAGGTGKSRLALEIAGGSIDLFPEGVWYVELAALTDPALVPQSVAAALEIHEKEGHPILETLTDFLREKGLLLLLDNCEHLVESCASLVHALLQACPGLKVLATSREALGVSGEVPLRVPTLSTPDPQHLPPASELLKYEGVRLFIERAATSLPSFSPTNENISAIARICCRLDGIPLAIELAAARVKMLSVDQIAVRLEDGFKLLTGGSRTALPRLQTLRAAIDWSYNLLSPPERQLLERLSVFAGGWTLEAAESVCNDENGEMDILDLMTRLINKSLIVVDSERGGEVRYRMLETIRLYSRERLQTGGEEDKVHTRHLDYYQSLAEIAAPKLLGPDQHNWLVRLDIEQDNLRSALEWSIHPGCVEKGMHLAFALLDYWDIRGYNDEGVEFSCRLLNQPEAASRTLVRAEVLYIPGYLLDQTKQSLAREYLEESIQIAREYGEAGKRTLVLGLVQLAKLNMREGQGAALSMAEESVEIARSLRDPWVLAWALEGLGGVHIDLLDHSSAKPRLEESERIFESLGDRFMAAELANMIAHEEVRLGNNEGGRQRLLKILSFLMEEKAWVEQIHVLNALGVISHAEGDYDLAEKYYREALAYARDVGRYIFSPAKNLGNILLYKGDLEGAKRIATECMNIALQSGRKVMIAYAVQSFAGIAAAEKQCIKAIRLLGAVRKLQEESLEKGFISPAGEADFSRHLNLVREQVDEDGFNTAWVEGRALTLDQAVAYSLEAN